MKLDPRIGSENFLRMLDPQNANSWPRDAPEFVFLARAFDQIGRAKYGEHWDERFEIEPWPEAGIAKREEFAERYERWLEEDEEDERRDDQEQSDEDRTDRQLFHKFVILTFREEEDRAAFGARYGELRNKLAGEIADQLELGNLVAAARPKISGAFNDLESHNWSGENRVDLVFRCSIAHRWIFVRRNSLENYLQGLALLWQI